MRLQGYRDHGVARTAGTLPTRVVDAAGSTGWTVVGQFDCRRCCRCCPTVRTRTLRTRMLFRQDAARRRAMCRGLDLTKVARRWLGLSKAWCCHIVGFDCALFAWAERRRCQHQPHRPDRGDGPRRGRTVRRTPHRAEPDPDPPRRLILHRSTSRPQLTRVNADAPNDPEPLCDPSTIVQAHPR